LTVWGKQAEFLGKYATKGDLVIWTGAAYNVERFTKKDGSETDVHFFEIGQNGMINLVSKQRQDSSHDGEPSDANENAAPEVSPDEPPANGDGGGDW